VVAYGSLIPASILEAVPHGFLNVHFSLLPRWRGASPVEHALIAGDDVTGVTVMRLDEGLDTGPIVAQRTVPIHDADDAATLGQRLAEAGADLLLEVLEPYLAGKIEPRAQDDTKATYAPRLSRRDFFLDPQVPASELWRLTRAGASRGGAVIRIDGDPLKVWKASVEPCDVPPGQVVVDDAKVLVGTGGGCLKLVEVQPPGRRRMPADAWLRGLRTVPRVAERPSGA
jgi:methionyl-tRNA formyltransferase